jgi:hypothetical protein
MAATCPIQWELSKQQTLFEQKEGGATGPIFWKSRGQSDKGADE